MQIQVQQIELAASREQIIDIDPTAQLLTVHGEGPAVYLFALISPHAPTRGRRIFILRSGETVNVDGRIPPYIGSVIAAAPNGDAIVLHIFDGGPAY